MFIKEDDVVDDEDVAEPDERAYDKGEPSQVVALGRLHKCQYMLLDVVEEDSPRDHSYLWCCTRATLRQ